MDYESFIAGKFQYLADVGFRPIMEINRKLFRFQRAIVRWALRKGRCAIFANCGLGKSFMQLEWAKQVAKHTGKAVLILCPLAVASQTIKEAKKLGIKVKHLHESEDIEEMGIQIINYDRLDRLIGKIHVFSGVVLDESSVLKALSGKTRIALTEAFSQTPYRLCCTATPSPNDFMELGQHSEFLGVCTFQQMLATWFINDTFDTGTWRLKHHAEDDFWRWVGSWAACLSKPSDIGFEDDGYDLPPLNLQEHIVVVDESSTEEGELFRSSNLSATTMHRELALTCNDRCAKVVELIKDSPERWLLWCNTNQEADELQRLLPEAREVRGSDKISEKESAIEWFTEDIHDRRILISKSSIFGYGLNLQICHNIIFVSLSYSFEDFYQAIRRSYRFGQINTVNAHIVRASTENAMIDAVREKMANHETMQQKMKLASQIFKDSDQSQVTMKQDITIHEGTNWRLYHGDCVRVASTIEDNSIGLSVFSPPFADLFTYSNDVQDMGNCASMEEFHIQFGFLIKELLRIMIPGREVAVHCCDLLSTKWKHGKIELQDFSGQIVNSFRSAGFLFHSRITIWKSPVTEMQRTKAHGLLYKTLRKDSSDSRVGAPEYLLVFRKPGENPNPIIHDEKSFPLSLWQEVASPVWMTINQGNVLNGKQAREKSDERHICPLQLDVIERAIMLWSNPGDMVFSPFTGIGSEGWQAIKMGRKFVGSELKESYVRQAKQFLEMANSDQTFDFMKCYENIQQDLVS